MKIGQSTSVIRTVGMMLTASTIAGLVPNGHHEIAWSHARAAAAASAPGPSGARAPNPGSTSSTTATQPRAIASAPKSIGHPTSRAVDIG